MDAYVKSKDGVKKGKWSTNDEDQEDFEQEKQIQEWLKSQGNASSFEFKHINRNGRARNTLVKAAISLDQEIREDGSGTFADIIAGSDGRDLFGGDEFDGTERDPLQKISGYLSALGFEQGEVICLIRTLKSSIDQNKWRSEKSQKSLESWKQFEPFST
jgi:hypothetical protein